jgi:hypothetical protein
MLGGAGMEAAGYENPAIAQAKRQQEIMGMGGDMSTSVGLKAKAAQFAQMGDQQTAMKLIMLARKQEMEEAKIGLENAQAAAALHKARAEASPFAKIDPSKYTQESLRTYMTSRNPADLVAFDEEKNPNSYKEYVLAKAANPDIESYDKWLLSHKKAGAAGGTTVVMPGEKNAIDIPKFEQSVQGTIKPHLETVTAADMATAALQNSMKTGNYSSFNAAKQQLARAFSDGTISRAEVVAAGADPSMVGGIVDATSTLFTGTPSIDTQQKMLKTLEIARKVAANKGQTALTRMKKVGEMSGIKKESLDTLLTFPEFEGKSGMGAGETKTLKSGKKVQRID